MTAVTGDTLTVVRDFEGIVVGNGGTSGGWAYPSAVGINPSQIVYVQLRLTAYGAGNALAKDGNLEGLESAAEARANLGISAANTPNTPAGNIAATTVQAALNELDAEKVQITSSTGSAKLPAGTTAQRDVAPEEGWTRFNSTLGKNETWNGFAWASSIDSANPVFTGLLSTDQRINIAASYGALQVNGKDVLRFGLDTSGQLAGFRNILINSGFQINNGNAGTPYVSGAVLAAGQYGHEMWKAGESGGNYTFTQLKSATQITIASGKSLIQVIEDCNVEGGSYVLSWKGTAKARVGINSATPSGAYAVSPILITGQMAGTVASVEFTNDGSGGTLLLPQEELGSIDSKAEIRPYSLELSLCQRYYRRFNVKAYHYCSSTGDSWYETHPLHPQMRATPTAAQIGTWTPTNVGSVTHTTYPGSYILSVVPAGVGMCGYCISGTAEIALSARL